MNYGKSRFIKVLFKKVKICRSQLPQNKKPKYCIAAKSCFNELKFS